MDWFYSNFVLTLAAEYRRITLALLVIAFIYFGRRDLRRFSLERTRAIARVCFSESLRRRVLWVTPLAMAAVIVITLFQPDIDAQFAIGQTIKTCLFATGVVAILTTLILACTSLPREIENRVIFTILTKPTTRLEVILGKILGFSTVSALILLVMGAFSWTCLRVTSHHLLAGMNFRLTHTDVDDADRNRINQFLRTGLLTASRFNLPGELNVFGVAPDPNAPSTHIITTDGGEDCLVAYPVDRTALFGPAHLPLDNGFPNLPVDQLPPTVRDTIKEFATPEGIIDEIVSSTRNGVTFYKTIATINNADEELILAYDGQQATIVHQSNWAQRGAGEFGLLIHVDLRTHRTGPATDQPQNAVGPQLPETADESLLLPPLVMIQLFDQDDYDLVQAGDMIGGTTRAELNKNISLFQKNPQHIPGTINAYTIRLTSPATPGGLQGAYAWIPPQQVTQLFNHPKFYVRICGSSGNTQYIIGPHPVTVFYVPSPNTVVVPPLPGPDPHSEQLAFHGRVGIHLHQELRGGADAPDETAVYTFHAGDLPADPDGQVHFQINTEIDRTGTPIEEGESDDTRLDLELVDLATHTTTAATSIQLESSQSAFFALDRSKFSSPDFQIMVHCRSTGHTISLVPSSLRLVLYSEPFEWNLIKSLFILWMMTVLVITLAVFASVWLSWPIALVLTIVLLLGHWTISNLSDVSGADLGPRMVNDLGITNAASARAFSASVNGLTTTGTILSKFLPDSGQFSAIDDIQSGVAIAPATLLAGTLVLLKFGIPAVIVGYFFFRGTEVAP